MTTKETLARLLWAELAAAGVRQCDAAATVGISEKHLSQMITGKVGMSLNLVDQILRECCGRRVTLATEPITQPGPATP
jgi:plasmid maintenance system antidote protein VapI